jgi:hypothetical protein
VLLIIMAVKCGCRVKVKVKQAHYRPKRPIGWVEL